MERLKASNVSVSNGNIKCLIGKSIFAVNLALKLFRTTVANAETGCLNSLYTLVWFVLGSHAGEIWTKVI